MKTQTMIYLVYYICSDALMRWAIARRVSVRGPRVTRGGCFAELGSARSVR